MATDRNDALLATISGQLGDLAGLLADIRDRLPAPVQEAEPVVEVAPESDVEPEPVLLEEPVAPAVPARKPGRRAPKAKTKEAP